MFGVSAGKLSRQVVRVEADVQHTLEVYPFTEPRVKLLEAQIQRHVESMTYEHVSNDMDTIMNES